MKIKASQRVQILTLLIGVVTFSACSSSSQNNSTTTIDPQVAALQKQVEKLQAQVNATTLPPPTTKAPKPTARPYITRTSRFPSSYSKFASNGQHSYECRVIDYYSDGTSFEGGRYWVTLDKWYYGACG